MKELVEFAQKSIYGVKEVAGNQDNPIIMKMFQDIGHSWVQHDETAWCAAAHSWIHKMNGYPSTNKLNARSWENFGEELQEPEYGCTVVLWRVSKESGYGHVGFFIREDGDYIWMLGGNQNNQYNISKYAKDKVLSYRKIIKHPVS